MAATQIHERIMSKVRIAACFAFFAAALAVGISADAPQNSAYELPSNRQVVAFLLQSIDWYRHSYAERQIASDPADRLFLDDNQPIEAQIVQLSFEFAKADAALAATATPSRNQSDTTPANPPSSDLARFITLQDQTDEASQNTAQQIEKLKKDLAAARGADRSKLQAALEEAQSRLDLLRVTSKTVDDLVNFVQSAGDLGSTVDDLAKTVPEVSNPATASAKSPTDQSSRATAGTHEGGILALGSAVSDLDKKLRVIGEKMRLTDNLGLSAQNLRVPMAGFISRRLQSGAVYNLHTDDLASLQQHKIQLDALTVQLQGLSPAIVALDKQKVLLTLYRSHLEDWRSTVADEHRQAWRKLIVRLLIVAVMIAMLIGIGEISRRFAIRRVQDLTRRRFIGMAQRLLTLLAIFLVAAFGLASDLSPFATYLGLLTAGIAVALQNVILAAVSYPLLVGQRGIRIGQRIQVSGITGDVFDIGLLQFQLREFDVQKQQYSGHVVTFLNSLVFASQATGLLKFNSDDLKAGQSETNNSGAAAVARERGSAAAGLQRIRPPNLSQSSR